MSGTINQQMTSSNNGIYTYYLVGSYANGVASASMTIALSIGCAVSNIFPD
jgi:hypothetical protein